MRTCPQLTGLETWMLWPPRFHQACLTPPGRNRGGLGGLPPPHLGESVAWKWWLSKGGRKLHPPSCKCPAEGSGLDMPWSFCHDCLACMSPSSAVQSDPISGLGPVPIHRRHHYHICIAPSVCIVHYRRHKTRLMVPCKVTWANPLPTSADRVQLLEESTILGVCKKNKNKTKQQQKNHCMIHIFQSIREEK